jgi:long-chain acyl-CoA synthetase
VFLGYYKNESATKEVLDADGWLHTGDLGKINERGLVQIIGRKKEILKTSGGKMIAPYPIEEKIKTLNIISQVCLVGDNRKYITALITLNEQGFKFLKDSHVNMTQFETIEDEKINLEIKKKIDEVNSSLSSYEKIKKFKILSKDFSVEAGELTPTLKLKRGIIEKKYHDIIDKMYID